MSSVGDVPVPVPVPDEAVESSASSSKRTKIPLLTNPLAGDSLLQMSTPLPTLPFELITDILCRLPVKSLMKFKCVCKPWNSLISDRKFARKHFRMSTMNPNLIFTSNDYTPPEVSHPIYPLRSIFANVTTDAKQIKFPLNSPFKFHHSIIGSCDGILCLAFEDSENICIQFVLWNPATRKYNILPSLETSKVCGPVYGFGYDRFADNYKVVAVFRYRCDSSPDYITQVKVHTLGTNSWRLIDDFPYGRNCGNFPFQSSGKFVSGTLNWLSITVRSIVSLDLGTESFQEILEPDYGGMVNSSTLGVLRDCLSILHGQDIWLMKEYGNRDSWTKLASVPYFGPYCNVPYISEDDQVLMEFMPTLYEWELAVYDSKNGTLKSLDIKKVYHLMCPYIYVESLISPCS